MPNISIFVRVQSPRVAVLAELVDSLIGQTDPSWELNLLVSDPTDQTTATAQSQRDARIRVQALRDDELPLWAAHRLLASVGTWVLLLEQHDRLVPEALAQLLAGAHSSNVRLVYADSEYRNRANHVSLRTSKGAFDPYRLRHQHYLGDPLLLRRDYLQAAGIDRRASTCPSHDLALRAYETYGAAAFSYVPERLVQHYRTHMEGRAKHPGQEPYLAPYDLTAIENHLARQRLPALVGQHAGTVSIHFRPETKPSLTAVIVVDNDDVAGLDRLHRFNRSARHRPMNVRVRYLGDQREADLNYRQLCQGLGYNYARTGQNLPQVLNQEARSCDTDKVLFLQGSPINDHWLDRLMGHVQLPGVVAAGSRLVTGRWLTQPGIQNYRYEGWDWNTRGRFNRMAVSHQTCMLSAQSLLVDTRKFLGVGGFNEALPSLFAMDLGRRLDTIGALVMVPSSQVEADPRPVVPAAFESEALQELWPAWQDRFGLHL